MKQEFCKFTLESLSVSYIPFTRFLMEDLPTMQRCCMHLCWIEYAVQIGDTYEDGRFYHDGEPIYSLTEQLAETQLLIDILTGEVE